MSHLLMFTFEYSSQNVCDTLNKMDRFDGERPLHGMTCYLRHYHIIMPYYHVITRANFLL